VGSSASPSLRERSNSTNTEILDDESALKPDSGKEHEFVVENNPFAFSPGQLSKLINPKSYGAFHALRGLSGLEKGLRTNIHTGLSIDEDTLPDQVSFQDVTGTAAPEIQSPTKSQELHKRRTSGKTLGGDEDKKAPRFTDRKRVYGDNRLPERKSKSFLRLAWMALQDKVLILLSIAAVVSLALGLYQTFGQTHESGARVEWVEGVAIIVAIFIVVVVGAVNDWQKERQFVKLNKKKTDREVKVIRSGRTFKISVHDILVGDLMILEQGDVIPVDGIYISGYNVSCDESSATGESDILKKSPAEEVFKAMEEHREIRKLDPFIISGAKVQEGVGQFLVTATGVNSSHGRTLVSLHADTDVTPLQLKLNVLAGKFTIK
jgi:P-type Ca2+ transporter type 2C